MERNKKRFELGVSIVILLIVCFLMYVSFITPTIPVSSGLASMDFPRIVFVFIILLSIAQIIVSICWFVKHPIKNNTEPKAAAFDKKVVLTAVLFCIYAALWNVIGFSLSSVIYFFIQTKLLDKKKPTLHVALISVLLVAVIDLLFVFVFKIHFPEPLLTLIRGY